MQMGKRSSKKVKFLNAFLLLLEEVIESKNIRSTPQIAELAQRKGFDLKKDAVAKYRSGTEPGIYGFMALCAALDVPPNDLLPGEKPKSEQNEIQKILKQLDTMRGEAYNLTDPRLKEYAERFAALPEGLRKAAEQLLRAMEEAAQQKETDQ
jgi:transcriptional regulator with XRE-family HTH domain